MEHRWGERVAVRMTVELSWGSSPPVAGDLENLSSSGAFVRTAGGGPPRGPVQVILRRDTFGRQRSVRLAAYVVRESEAGVGIEWCEFAPRLVRELVIRDRGAGTVQARARVPRAARRSAQIDNTTAPSRAQLATEPAALATHH